MRKMSAGGARVFGDYETKARALIAAIRAYGRPDVDMDVHMSPSDLFNRATRCLSDASAHANLEQGKLVSEAAQLVSSLNALIEGMCAPTHSSCP